MIKSRFIILLSALLLAMSSCTIKQDIHFKEDMSGSNTMTFDYAETKSLLGGFGDMGESGDEDNPLDFSDGIMDEESINEYNNGINIKDGLSNPHMTESNDAIVFGFDFDNLDALMSFYEDAQEGGEGIESGLSQSWLAFNKNKKKMEVTMDYSVFEELFEDDEMADMKGMAEMMYESFVFDLNLTFDQEIKKVKGEGLGVYDESSNSVRYNFNLSDIMDKKGSETLVIKFK